MSNLDTRLGSPGVNCFNDRLESLGVFVAPNAQAVGADAGGGLNTGHFDNDGTGPTPGQGPVVGNVVGSGFTVLLFNRVLAHGRNPKTVTGGHGTQGKGFEEGRSHVNSAFQVVLFTYFNLLRGRDIPVALKR